MVPLRIGSSGSSLHLTVTFGRSSRDAATRRLERRDGPATESKARPPAGRDQVRTCHLHLTLFPRRTVLARGRPLCPDESAQDLAELRGGGEDRQMPTAIEQIAASSVGSAPCVLTRRRNSSFKALNDIRG